jgi:hypothetical protein
LGYKIPFLRESDHFLKKLLASLPRRFRIHCLPEFNQVCSFQDTPGPASTHFSPPLAVDDTERCVQTPASASRFPEKDGFAQKLTIAIL